LRSPQPFPQCDVLICESTYGDRLHEKVGDADARLLEIVQNTCVKKGGKLIIPAFSVDRTQELIYQLEKMENANFFPDKSIVDSPLSTRQLM
jgi:metallo-beta-lactamase family protein